MVTWILKYKKILISRIREQSSNDTVKALLPADLSVSWLEDAQQEIIRLHQQQVFSEEIEYLRDGVSGVEKVLQRRSRWRSIYKLDPYLDENGLLKVWGKLEKSNLHISDIHSVLIGKDVNITRLQNGVITGWHMVEESLP